MEIVIKRIAKKSTYTIGKLYIDNKYFCDTLEDKDRGLKDTMSIEEILNIKGFDGIRFHSGNTDKDSSGCVILGQNRVVGKVINSRVTCDKFISLLTGAKNKQEKITLTIE